MCLTIRDALTRAVVTISPDGSVAAAARLMHERHISCLVAVEAERPVGIITEADLVRIARCYGCDGTDPAAMPVADVLSAPVISIKTDHSIYEAFEILLQHRMSHLVVIRPDGRLEGVLTFSDILKAAEFDDFLCIKPVASVMSEDVISADPETPLDSILAQMDERHISCIVALRQGRACGAFTKRDATGLIATGADIGALTLGAVMSEPLITMRADDSLLDAALLMRKHGFRRLVIIDDDRHPVGIVTQLDVIRGLEGKVMHHFRQRFEQTADRLLSEKAELERIVAVSPAVLYRSEWQMARQRFVLTYISASVCDILGYQQQQCLQPEWWESHIHPDDRREVECSIEQMMESGEFERVYRFADNAGNWRWLRDHACLNRGRDGRPDELIGSMLDITESRQLDQQVDEREEIYRSLVEQAFEGIVILDADGRVVFANRACAQILGADEHRMIGKFYLDFVHPDERAAMRLRFRQRMDGNGAASPHELRLIDQHGETVWVEMNGRLISWRDQPADLLTLHDISERKAWEQEAQLRLRLRETAARAMASYISEEETRVVYAELLQMLLDGTGSEYGFIGEVRRHSGGEPYLKTRAITDVACNDETRRLYRENIASELEFDNLNTLFEAVLRSGEVVISNDSRAGALPGGHPPLNAFLGLPIIANGEMVGMAGVANRPGGYHTGLLQYVEPMLDAIGNIIAGYRVRQQREAARRELLASERKYRSLFDDALDMIFIIDAAGAIVDVNAAGVAALGYRRDAIIGRPVVLLVAPVSRDICAEIYGRMRLGESIRACELQLLTASGVPLWVEVSVSPQREQGTVTGARTIMRDISRRKQAEKQMRLLENAVAAVTESIIITDADGSIVYVNPAFTRNTGFSPDEAIGQTPSILNSHQQSEGFYEQFWQTISSGKPWSGRILDRKKDGTIFPVFLSVAPIFSEQGEITHYVAVHEDLTRAEALQKQIMEAQKMEAVGTMVGGIAHDFKYFGYISASFCR